MLHSEKLREIEDYYERCAEEGKRKSDRRKQKAMSQMNVILGDLLA